MNLIALYSQFEISFESAHDYDNPVQDAASRLNSRARTRPLTQDMTLRRYIWTALKLIGVTKRIGWHGVRHGLATMLRQHGVDIKAAQELLRHANSRITLEVYQQAVGDEKRAAQNLAFRGLLGRDLASPPLQHFSSRCTL